MADVYRLTPTLLMTNHHRSESRMVIFLFITRTVWDRYLQVVNCQAGRYKRSTCFAGMAQWKRAGLITPRTQDRSLLPVSYSFCALKKHKCLRQETKRITDVAQRQRAWLITTRSLDRNGLSVFLLKSYKHVVLFI